MKRTIFIFFVIRILCKVKGELCLIAGKNKFCLEFQKKWNKELRRKRQGFGRIIRIQERVHLASVVEQDSK